MSFEEKIISAVGKLYNMPGVALIALYGSVARGEHDRRSDIDILMVYESKEAQRLACDRVMALLPELDVKVQLHETNIEDMGLEDHIFVENILKEGIILLARPKLRIPVEKILSLKPYSLFSYSVSGIEPSRVMALRRALYTYKGTKKLGGKKYTYAYSGLVSKYGKKLGRSCFMVPNECAKNVRAVFEQLRIPYDETTVWVE